jgi:hypothetical protein
MAVARPPAAEGELIVLPRRGLGESPFTKVSLPFASTEVEIWAWPGEASVSQALATSTATGMQFVFIMLADLRLLDDNGQRQLTTGLGRQSAIPRTNKRHA